MALLLDVVYFCYGSVAPCYRKSSCLCLTWYIFFHVCVVSFNTVITSWAKERPSFFVICKGLWGHLRLWRKVSLNNKYDRICNQIQFCLIFPVYMYHYVSMDKSINFAICSLFCGPCFDWHDHQIFILKKYLLILTANYMVYFYTHGS